jgi:hypothetical protein
MTIYVRSLLILGALIVLVFMLKRIRHAHVKIEYSIFWIGFSTILLLMGMFPKVVYWISAEIGFQSPINMVYLVVIFVLILKLFFTTLQISKLENKIDALAQQVAIDRKIDQEENR